MYRAIIIAERRDIRENLKSLPSWQAYGFGDVRVYCNGEQALADLHGLTCEMIIIAACGNRAAAYVRQVKAFNREAAVIVLVTDNRELHQELIQAADTVITLDAFHDETLYHLLATGDREYTQKKSLAGQAEIPVTPFRRDHLRKARFFQGEITGGDAPYTGAYFRTLKKRFTHLSAIVFYLRDWPTLRFDTTRGERNSYCLCLTRRLNQAAAAWGSYTTAAEVVYLGAGITACFVPHPLSAKDDDKPWPARELAAYLAERLSFEPYDFTTGISCVCSGVKGIQRAFAQGKEAVFSGFYAPRQFITYQGNLILSRTLPLSAKAFLELVSANDGNPPENQINNGFLTCMDDFKRERTDPNLVLDWLEELDCRLGLFRSAKVYGTFVHIRAIEALLPEYLALFYRPAFNDRWPEVNPAIAKALAYIDQHYREPLDLVTVAQKINLNFTYLSWLFKEELGIGFSKYLLSCRIKYAKELLLNTNICVKEVARRAGFQDSHYFSKAFKRSTGVTPLLYRRTKRLPVIVNPW